MSDRERPRNPGHHEGTGDAEGPDPALLRRRQAQGAAGDLARMGIDPRSLGLGGPPPSPSSASAPPPPGTSRSSRATAYDEPGRTTPADEASEGGSVLPFRRGPGVVPGEAERPPAPVAPQDPPARTRRVDRLLSRVDAPESPGRQASRLARSVARGLLTPDAAAAAQSERELVESVRHRQSERRTIAFVSGKGGVGVTTVAVGVGTTLMALREDRSVVVDVQSATASLAESLGAGRAVRVSAVARAEDPEETPTTAAGLGLVDGVGWDQSVSRRDLGTALDLLAAEHTFHLIDAGNDAGDGAHAALARADQVVAVAGPGEVGLRSVAGVLDRIREVNPGAAHDVVHVVVCPHEDALAGAQQTLAALAAEPGAAVLVPPDSHLRRGRVYDPALVGGDTRLALLRVAAALAVGGQWR